MAPTRESPSRARFALRGLVAVGVAVYLLVGPVVGQVFGVRTANSYPRWQMFAGKGRNVCQLEYTRIDASGAAVAIDHVALLRLDRGGPVRIEREHLPALSGAMCARVARVFGGPTDVRLGARCGSRAGWVEVARPVVNLCAR